MAFRRGGGRGLRRPTEWIGFDTAVQADTATANIFFILLTAAQLSEYITPTIVRVRGIFLYQCSGNIVQTASGPFRIGIGMTIVSAQAAAAASVPVAIVDLDANWFLWDSFGIQNSALANEFTADERVIDSKAMRKIEQPDNASMVLAVSTTFGGTTGICRYRATGRILIKGD